MADSIEKVTVTLLGNVLHEGRIRKAEEEIVIALHDAEKLVEEELAKIKRR